jgi:hypothetical protein
MQQPREPIGTRAQWIGNTVAAIILVSVFMLMVMTAIAQQKVISRIKSEQLNLGYGTALAIRGQAEKREGELAKLAIEERTLTNQFRIAQTKFRESTRAFEDAWESLLPFLQRISRAGACEITLPAESNVSIRVNALNEYRQCQGEGASSRLITAAQSEAAQFTAVLQTHRQVYNEFATAKEKLEDTQTQLKANALSPDQLKVSNSFSDMDVLLSSPLLLGGFLVPLPPAMLQILLTFVSGIFGAILITFVLLVYPKGALKVTQTTKTWTRIMLGGMVALCVYIVLLGGTAILGTNTGIIAAGTNYMAFCGIGILAGMFSDRVAGWLSDRADSFFSRPPPP